MSVMLSVLTGLYAWGNSIDVVLQQWESMGIFEYVLPFLLVFALIFGILVKSNILGENRGVNIVIALAAGLLAIQSFTLRSFFRTIFPYAGIGIAILLVLLILTGLFLKGTESWGNYVFYGVGAFIAVVVILSSLSSYEWMGGWWWQENWSVIVTFAIIIGLLLLVILATKKNTVSSTHH